MKSADSATGVSNLEEKDSDETMLILHTDCTEVSDVSSPKIFRHALQPIGLLAQLCSLVMATDETIYIVCIKLGHRH